MEKRRRLIPTTAVTAALLLAVAVPLASGVAPRALASDQPTATASIVKVDNWKAPRKKVVRRHFRLWRHPTPGQVREIIRAEAKRWGIPAASLSRRVACESRYRWYAMNGQYAGLLQFNANAFYRGMHSIRSHAVKLVRTRSRRVHDARITHYSDGREVRRRTTPRRQRVIVVLKGRIPRNPAIANPFAQLRIGAQAIRGISAVHSSEWACGA
jgi:hypothetical protein